jgi:flagellar biosynthetic protein FlhB
MRLAAFLAGVLALIGIADFIYQKRRFENSLRMTKQEVKDEMKREEGDPMIKARIRQLGRERARRRMLAAVPKATVVITNPLHLAVALRYEQGKGKSAPVLVAKGAGALARRIVAIARQHGVPVFERPPLAQALYKNVPEDKEIPQALFKVVAEILALVYRLRGIR